MSFPLTICPVTFVACVPVKRRELETGNAAMAPITGLHI